MKSISIARLRAGLTTALGILVLGAALLPDLPARAAIEDVRLVPQLSLTDLDPNRIAFAPDDETLLMVVNRDGRIDLFDISNPDRPVKTAEIATDAQDAEFTPKGTPREDMRIVSGGDDGTVRLWTLDGKPAAEPFRGHESWVWSVAFSPDGTHIASGSGDGTVRLWTLDGKLVAEPFEGHEAWVLSVAFSPDGTRIVSGSEDGTVRLWTLDGRPVAEPFKGHDGRVRSVVFSADGTRIISAGNDGTIRLWTLDGRPAAAPFEGHDGAVRDVVISPDGTRIVSAGSDGTVRLWTLDGRPATEPFKGHDRTVRSVAFSPDGTHIASGSEDGTVRLWTFGGTLATEPLAGHGGPVPSVALSPDGTHMASGGADGTVRLWTLDGKPAAEPFEGHAGAVWSVAFSPDDGTRIVSGGQDGTVRLWTLDGKPAAEPFEGHDGGVLSVAFSPDGAHVVSGGQDGTVRLWGLDGTPAAEPFTGHDGQVLSVAFSPSGARVVSGGADGTVRLWNLDGTLAAEPFEGHDGKVPSVAFSPDGTHIVSAGSDGTIRLWALDGTPAAEPFKGHDGAVLNVAYSPDGTRILSGGTDGTLRLWTRDGAPAAEPFKGHNGWVLSVAFSPGGRRIASAGYDGTVRLWTLDGMLATDPFKGSDSRVLSIAFSPDGTHIASGGDDGTVQLWALDGTQAATPFEGHDGRVMSVAFSPDGTRIASGGEDGTIRLWALDGTQAATPFEGHDGAVLSVAFSPDGKRIAFGNDGGTIRLWVPGGTATEPFEGDDGAVLSVAFSPDGSRILSGGEDGVVRLRMLDGTQAAEPFKGHDGSVLSVAFSPDGTSILSGGEDGTVRLWSIASPAPSIVHSCHAEHGLGFVQDRFVWIGCSDRIAIQSMSFEPRGAIFLHDEGLIALVDGEGVHLPSDRVQEPFRAIGENGYVIWQRGAVPELSAQRARQVLLDDWTFWERVVDTARRAYALALKWYDALGWWRAPFWPALGWLIAIIGAIATWVLAPHKLAHWVMPVIGSPKLPAWKWLAGVLTLFGYLGTTRRPLKAWLRKHHETLYEQNFAARAPVRERERYCSLGHEDDITTFKRDVTIGKRALLWVEGVGGSGKSSLAFQMFRGPIWDRKAAPVPILLDEDWDGRLVDHVAQLLKVGERSPTPEMVETLGAAGHLCLLVDSLSERGMANAAEQVADVVAKGVFKSVVVTSREAVPSGQIWESFKTITARPLTVDQLPDYVATYAPEDRRDEILERIKQLFRVDKPMSPLFVRFAIEQALEGELHSTSALDLVLKYVEALRAGKVNLSADDMIRAAAVAAREAVRESLVPREIGTDYLRGVLVHEADDMAFMDAAPKQPVDPAAIIEMLVECGLLNRNRTNRRLRFAYDPVAELLAAYGIAQAPPREGTSELKSRILSAPDSAIAHAMEEIGGSLKVA